MTGKRIIVIIKASPALAKTGIRRELKMGNMNKITPTLISMGKNDLNSGYDIGNRFILSA